MAEVALPGIVPEGRTQLRVARLLKAHGLKGALKLELYTDEPQKRFTPGASFTLQVPTSSPWHGKTLELVELRFYNGNPVGFFKGIDDRDAAETLVKAILWISEDLTAETGEDDAWYDHQLVGLRVVRDGVTVGTIKQVDHLPAQDLLIVTTPTGEVMVPFVSAIVPSVDVKAGFVTVTPPTGLFEEIPDDGPDETYGSAAATPSTDEGEDGTDADAQASVDVPADDAPAEKAGE